MSTLVQSYVDNRTVTLTAADLGLTTALIGAGTLVTLVDKLPSGWSVRAVQIRRNGTITNATGTTLLTIGVDGDEDAIVDDLDIEGSGVAWLSPTVVRYDSVASVSVVARITTGTAAPAAINGLSIGVDLVKYDDES